MPYILNPNGSSSYGSLGSIKYSYKYPLRMNLQPGSEQHGKILSFVLDCAQKSRDAMSNRYETWRKMDKTLTAYISLDEKEEVLKNTDERKPVSTVVPVTYATMDTILTYLVGTFMQTPIFRYEGRGPEDTIGAMLMEAVVDAQADRFRAGLALHTMFRDMLAYGFGAVTPVWTKKTGYRRTAEPDGILSSLGRMFQTGFKKKREEVTLFEGNRLYNIDPYKSFLDPQCSAGSIQDSRYVGWLRRESMFDLLNQEEWDTNLFNCKYLKHIDGRSVYGEDESQRDKDLVRQDFTLDDSYRYNADVIYLYIDIIPSSMGLGSNDRPEKWLFAVAGDSVVLKAGPCDLDHNMFPVGMCAAEYDGYSVAPLARLEVVGGLQTFIDFLYNSHMTNVRKAVNDMFVVDPELVNINDLRNPSAGRLIRLRKKAWGRGVKDAVEQLQIYDVTKNHLQDVSFVSDLVDKVIGTPDALQGVMRQSSERRSATEFRETKGSALSRLERLAWVASLQAMSDLAYIYASQTQQFMSVDQYVKIVGRHEQELRAVFGDASHALVDPLAILVDYDIKSGSSMLPTSGDPNQWAAMFQIIAANPQLAMQFDTMRIFQYWAKLTGAKNLEDFVLRGPQVNAQVMPDEQVEQQAQAGNIIPINEAMNG